MASVLDRLLARDRRCLHVWLLSILVGATAFFVWIRYARTLDPTDLGWMWHEDPFTHAMGWEQFRNAPLLQYPITKNELYGLEWSSTIVFTDSIPIVALLLRPFSALLPVPFQYLGWWVLLCMVMQAYWGARLVLLRSDRLRDAALGAVFFVTAPVLLERLGLQTGVGSHWLILWALWLYFGARDPAALPWAALLLLTVAVHAYIFVMVGAIWAAHLVSCRVRGWLGGPEFVRVAGTLVAVLVWMHVLGYFVVGGGAAGGSWRSSFDLAGFIAPANGARLRLMGDVIDDPWDGSAYLGGGVLLLLIASALAFAARRTWRTAAPAQRPPWWPLLIVMAGLGLFAITSVVTIANKGVISVRLPGVLNSLYDTFRGANRMIWPAYYLVITAALWLTLRAWPAHLRAAVLGVAVVAQLVDLEGMAAIKRREIQGDGQTRELQHPIWTTIAQHYQNVVGVPGRYRAPHWPTLAWYAAQHRLGCNVTYVSRTNREIRLAGARSHLRAILSGQYEPGIVYYIPSTALWNAARHAMGPNDLAIVADGFQLIVPGGRAFAPDPGPPPPSGTPLLGEWITFGDEDTYGLLLDGWSWHEWWGTWSIGPASWLVLPVPANERVRVTFKWRSGVPRREQRLRVHLGSEVFDVTFPRSISERSHALEVTTTGRMLEVRVEIAERVSKPNEREIGIGLIAARVQRASEPRDDLPEAARVAPILGSWISFAGDGPGRPLLQGGWSWAESWGTWSDDIVARLALAVPANDRVRIGMRWLATAPPGVAQHATVTIDGRPFEVDFAAGRGTEREDWFEVTTTRGWVQIELRVRSPVEAKDGRLLGVGLQAARVERVPAPPRE